MALASKVFRPQVLFGLKPPVVLFVLLVLIAGFWTARTQHVRAVTGQWPTDAKLGLSGVKAIASQWHGKLNNAVSGEGEAVYDDNIEEVEWHPIRLLHEQALQKYTDMMNRQSKTLEEAVEEYIRRYDRDPPPGFEDWYRFAKSKNSRIIDNYDLIEENLAPFWKVSPELLREMPEKLMEGHVLEKIAIRDGQAQTGHWMGREIQGLLSEVMHKIPNLDILINPLDEPRVLAPKDAELTSLDDVTWTETSHSPSWDTVTAQCDKTQKAIFKPSGINTYGFPFVTDRATAMNVCHNPSYAQTHGFFISPTTLISTESPIPILSQAGLSTFGDILTPSFAYWSGDFAYHDEFDIDWTYKSTKLYWAGSTTGLWNSLPVNESAPVTESHRHRLISLTHNLNPHRSYPFLTRSSHSRPWTRYTSDEPMHALYNTTFTRLVQCEEESCDWMADYYGVGPRQDQHAALRYKFQMDLDGNSFSGRFYRLLASRSCPLKMTIFREWHDERLVPWVHYVPVSVSMEELPEVMRYLGLTEEGERIAHGIAMRGREAYEQMLRREDAAVYYYRLLLEFARVSSDDRNGEVDGRVLYE
ncbi:Hypothetical protein D9617_34g040870 [Elsinoe fawcettii]|nr:Hypothetical protein D9617_34g040870 [Elsinoe fawcettii]